MLLQVLCLEDHQFRQIGIDLPPPPELELFDTRCLLSVGLLALLQRVLDFLRLHDLPFESQYFTRVGKFVLFLPERPALLELLEEKLRVRLELLKLRRIPAGEVVGRRENEAALSRSGKMTASGVNGGALLCILRHHRDQAGVLWVALAFALEAHFGKFRAC